MNTINKKCILLILWWKTDLNDGMTLQFFQWITMSVFKLEVKYDLFSMSSRPKKEFKICIFIFYVIFTLRVNAHSWINVYLSNTRWKIILKNSNKTSYTDI